MANSAAANATSRTAPPPSLAAGSGMLTELMVKARAASRPVLMGVLNITPDSFSDGGQFLDPAAAIEQARRLVAEGADIVDIGAESTRPYGGMAPVSADDERARLAPILPAVVALGVPVSIDTMRHPSPLGTRRRCQHRQRRLGPAARSGHGACRRHAGAPVIIMHNRERADPAIDIVIDVSEFFSRSLEIAWDAGISRDRVVLDPGIGFGKTPEQSMACIGRLGAWRGFEMPLLVGASRKRFIASVVPSEPQERLGGSLAAHLIAAENGAAIIRTHDVAPTLQALAVAAAIRQAR